MNIHRSIDVIIAKKVKSPALFGYFHPRLLLPEFVLEDFSDEEMIYVFMHELGHLKRHDIAVSCLITVFQVIHWFNPLVWVAFYQMRIDQESACDSSVLSRLKKHQSVEYANVIVGCLERYCQNRQLSCMAGIMENKTQMKRRLAMIINYKKLSTAMTVIAVAFLMTTGLVFFTLTGFAEIQSQGEITESEQRALDEASAALKANDYSAAEKILEDYLAINPTYKPEILYQMLGSAYFNQKKFYDAADIYEEAYEAYPYRTQLLFNQVTCILIYADENKDKQAFIEAAELFEKYYEINPGGDQENLKMAALAYYQGGNLTEAKRVFKRVIDLPDDTDQTDNIKALVRICRELGQEDEADLYTKRLEEIGESSSAPVAASDMSREKTDSNYDAGNAYGLNEIDEPPQVIRNVNPEYPLEAKLNNIEGRVVLNFIVTKEGTVREAKITESEPAGVFDEAALAAIEQYIFKPAMKGGEAVDCIVHAPMAFQLK